MLAMPRLAEPLLLALALGGAAGCRNVDYVSLEGGAYVMDEPNAPPELQGVTLDLDLDAGKATLSDGTVKQIFTLTRVPDRERWQGGCGTMSGHSMLEPVRLAPTTFNLVGQDWTFDTLHADCGGAGLRMTNAKSGVGTRWIFRRK